MRGVEPNITKLAEELRQAYAEELSSDPDFPGLTSAELKDVWSVSSGIVSNRLRALMAAGKLETGRRMVESIDGIVRPSPVYRVKE